MIDDVRWIKLDEDEENDGVVVGFTSDGITAKLQVYRNGKWVDVKLADT